MLSKNDAVAGSSIFCAVCAAPCAWRRPQGLYRLCRPQSPGPLRRCARYKWPAAGQLDTLEGADDTLRRSRRPLRAPWRTARPQWQESPRRAKPPRRPRTGHARRWRVLGWISVIMTVVVVSTSLVAYAEWRHLWGNIQKENVDGLLGRRPPKFNSALNILLIGSDSRAGSNEKFGHGVQGARSDTMILVHISPRRNGATLISFPRDSMVSTRSAATGWHGPLRSAGEPQVEVLNATFDLAARHARGRRSRHSPASTSTISSRSTSAGSSRW